MKNSKLSIILAILVILIILLLLKILFVKDYEHFNWSWAFTIFPSNGYLRGFNLKGAIIPIKYNYNNRSWEIFRLRNSGWYLCDGSHGTPDLRNKFILGGNSFNSNHTGGFDKVRLTPEEMPRHTHNNIINDPGHSHTLGGASGGTTRNNMMASVQGSDRSSTIKGRSIIQPSQSGISIEIEEAGDNQAHENMPPYHVLAYFMLK